MLWYPWFALGFVAGVFCGAGLVLLILGED